MTDISYANASFYGCTFASFQDTWYTGRNASTYVVDSVIFGETDCGLLTFDSYLNQTLLSQIYSASAPRE